MNVGENWYLARTGCSPYTSSTKLVVPSLSPLRPKWRGGGEVVTSFLARFDLAYKYMLSQTSLVYYVIWLSIGKTSRLRYTTTPNPLAKLPKATPPSIPLLNTPSTYFPNTSTRSIKTKQNKQPNHQLNLRFKHLLSKIMSQHRHTSPWSPQPPPPYSPPILDSKYTLPAYYQITTKAK
jgi:hypothetical protein